MWKYRRFHVGMAKVLQCRAPKQVVFFPHTLANKLEAEK